jgi:thiamine pyrophosphate-dependent acetolactate synthase large subunit-like protein
MFMALGELESAIAGGIPLLVVVYDDAAYGAELHHFAHTAVSTDLATFARRDLVAVAEALGAGGAHIRRPGDVAPALRSWLADRRGVFVAQMHVARTVRAPFMDEVV